MPINGPMYNHGWIAYPVSMYLYQQNNRWETPAPQTFLERAEDPVRQKQNQSETWKLYLKEKASEDGETK